MLFTELSYCRQKIIRTSDFCNQIDEVFFNIRPVIINAVKNKIANTRSEISMPYHHVSVRFVRISQDILITPRILTKKANNMIGLNLDGFVDI